MQVWAVDISSWPSAQSTRSALAPLLDRFFPQPLQEHNRDKVTRYIREVDRTRALAALLLPRLLLVTLHSELGLRAEPRWSEFSFSRTPEGRPFLTRPELKDFDFNVSHDGDWVVMAFTLPLPSSSSPSGPSTPRQSTDWTPARQTKGKRTVGIDVMSPILPHYEPSAESFLQTLSDSLTSRETEWIRTSLNQSREEVGGGKQAKGEGKEALRRLYDFWTYKEALTKNMGLGLGFDFKRVEVAFWALAIEGQDFTVPLATSSSSSSSSSSNPSSYSSTSQKSINGVERRRWIQPSSPNRPHPPTQPVLYIDGRPNADYTFTEIILPVGSGDQTATSTTTSTSTSNSKRGTEEKREESQCVICLGPLTKDGDGSGEGEGETKRGKVQTISSPLSHLEAVQRGLLRLWSMQELVVAAEGSL